MPRHAKLDRAAKVFGRQLKARRKEIGWSQEEFAYRAGIDISFISRCERGITSPSILMLRKMARTLGTSASELMDEWEREL